MLWIGSLLFCSYEGSSCCTVMAVSYIECRNLSENFSNTVNVCLVIDHPEVVSESVSCCEIILRFTDNVFVYDGIDLSIVRI